MPGFWRRSKKSREPPNGTLTGAVITREIRARVGPLLQEHGFSAFTPRTCWRPGHEQVQVVNFQSFNTATASVIGCTTYSFTVNLGVYFPSIPYPRTKGHIREVKGGPRPKVEQCHFRRGLRKNLSQPSLTRPDVWMVDPSGQNLAAVLEDAGQVLASLGLTWFDRFAQPGEALRTVLEDGEDTKGTWGFGAPRSPARSYVTAYLALADGKLDLSTKAFEEVLASGSFDSVRANVEADYERIPGGGA